MSCFVRVLVFAGIVLALCSERVVADGQPPAPSTTLTSKGLPPDTDHEPAANRSAMEWFKEGVDAYLSENWHDCIRAFENSIVEWHYFRQANIDCRLRCGEEARRAPHLFPDDVEHLHYAEELVRSTLCIIKCKKQAFRDHKTPDVLSASEQKVFRDLKTYEYLQLCYYQASQLQKAASAVFTILSNDPGNDIMKHNFKFYMSTPDFDVKNIINYESERYVSFYLMGTEAYYREDYKSAITNLEKSLKEFYQAVNECRADCEGPFDQGWLPDFTSSVANHFVYCLKCKTKCHSKLSRLNGEYYEDFLATHYHYLQFSYFKTGNLEDACAAAGTYLMFLPADETMLENVDYYKSLPKVQPDMFQPRAEAVLFIKREEYEDALLNYIADEFVFEEKKPSSNTTEPEETHMERSRSSTEEHSNEDRTLRELNCDRNNKDEDSDHEVFQFERVTYRGQKEIFIKGDNKSFGGKQKVKLSAFSEEYSPESQLSQIDTNLSLSSSNAETIEKQSERGQIGQKLNSSTARKISNFLQENDLGGVKRFLVDGLAGHDECQQMVQLAKVGGVRGDGYDGNKSPHSPQEKFEGVSLGRAALMVHFGLIEVATINLLLTLSERGRNITADYFNIPKKDLHFSYTHLVCRSAIPGKPFNASQFSHEIHADNCLLQRDGKCVQAYPAYFWRDYSAILYLNDDFDGGNFIFSADPSGKQIQSTIKPTCGRLVAFSAGRENLHGVLGVERGRRCALALWFTLDAQRAEWGRQLTEELLHQVKNGRNPKKQLIDSLQHIAPFKLREAQEQMLYISSCNDNGSEMHIEQMQPKRSQIDHPLTEI